MDTVDSERGHQSSICLMRITVAALALFAWEVLPRMEVIDPQFVPPLSSVLVTIRGLLENGDLLTHTLVSLQRAFSGLLAATLIGLPLGLVLGGWFPRLQQALEPLMELFAQANPVILAHIIIFFLGIGEVAKIFTICWLCIWPITFSTIAGIRDVDPQLMKAARSLGLGRWQLFLHVALPASAPSFFTGLRLAAGYAFLMLIASEMMGASNGLGWLVMQSQENYHIQRIFAGATIITALAVLTDLLLKVLEKRTLVWTDNGSGWLKPQGPGIPVGE
ncbi:ABC transporter, membrane protein [Geotalea daltonii FRC-32]|uniref:ABC transporter, membrane protein n=2 Tax=Geotalea TaxID=2910589 RepID=B9M067_GEODF|nr:ABC transporter, membrane protein [Geotalea daltonii FRC-32]